MYISWVGNPACYDEASAFTADCSQQSLRRTAQSRAYDGGRSRPKVLSTVPAEQRQEIVPVCHGHLKLLKREAQESYGGGEE